MSFIQIVDYRSARFDDIQKINAEWWNSEASVATARRVLVCRDRNDPDHYYTLAFFDSNESAMDVRTTPRRTNSRRGSVRWSMNLAPSAISTAFGTSRIERLPTVSGCRRRNRMWSPSTHDQLVLPPDSPAETDLNDQVWEPIRRRVSDVRVMAATAGKPARLSAGRSSGRSARLCRLHRKSRGGSLALQTPCRSPLLCTRSGW